METLQLDSVSVGDLINLDNWKERLAVVDKALISKGLCLRHGGLQARFCEGFCVSPTETRRAALDILKCRIWRPRKTMNSRRSSYGMKGHLEKWRNWWNQGYYYVSNEEFIAAMLGLGFKMGELGGKNPSFATAIPRSKTKDPCYTFEYSYYPVRNLIDLCPPDTLEILFLCKCIFDMYGLSVDCRQKISLTILRSMRVSLD